MLREVCQNRVWELYSLHGKKGKKSFTSLPIYRVIISKFAMVYRMIILCLKFKSPHYSCLCVLAITEACLKVYKRATKDDVNEELAEILKLAPYRDGGSKHRLKSKNDKLS